MERGSVQHSPPPRAGTSLDRSGGQGFPCGRRNPTYAASNSDPDLPHHLRMKSASSSDGYVERFEPPTDSVFPSI